MILLGYFIKLVQNKIFFLCSLYFFRLLTEIDLDLETFQNNFFFQPILLFIYQVEYQVILLDNPILIFFLGGLATLPLTEFIHL